MYEIFVMHEPLQTHKILLSFTAMLSESYILSFLKTLVTTIGHINDNK